MNKKWIITLSVLAVLALVLSVSCCKLRGDTASWTFIQKTGGIKTEKPLETEDGFYLPIICNVSGLDSITVKPTTINSALSCIRIKLAIRGNAIHLKVVTGVAMSNIYDCKCKAVCIGDLKPGDYTVYYGNEAIPERQIGSFTIDD